MSEKKSSELPAFDVGSVFETPFVPVQASSKTDQAIERWFVEKIHNSPVSRHTEIFNHVRSSVDELKRRIAKEL